MCVENENLDWLTVRSEMAQKSPKKGNYVTWKEITTFCWKHWSWYIWNINMDYSYFIMLKPNNNNSKNYVFFFLKYS